MALRPITVTQLNDYIARVFDSDTLLMNVAVTGEISNLKYHSSGHVYFSLNDENSKVNCFAITLSPFESLYFVLPLS